DPALADVAVVLPTPQVNQAWSQAGGNAAKNIGHLALAGTPVRVWPAQIPGTSKRERLGAAPAVGGGMLFAVDVNGSVQAFDAAPGVRNWPHQTDLGRYLRSSSVGGGARLAVGRVYATSGAVDVGALDAQTGAELWRVRPAGPLRGSQTIAFNAVYV